MSVVFVSTDRNNIRLETVVKIQHRCDDACGRTYPQHAMGSVADSLIDHYTGEAIKDKVMEERNSGRASGSGEFGADLWVEAMVRVCVCL